VKVGRAGTGEELIPGQKKKMGEEGFPFTLERHGNAENTLRRRGEPLSHRRRRRRGGGRIIVNSW